ncbi:MAG: glycosyltransferase family 2 protein [Gemmatimonadaceae bacterium]
MTRIAERSPAPFVSVIVPAYNVSAYLVEALDSLRAQTLADIEILVIDDGSNDDTLALARAAAAEDPRIRVIARLTPSGRPSCARNDGLRAARGTYIALLDADDIAMPTRLESAVAAMQLTGARFAFSDAQRLYESTGKKAAAGTLALAKFTEIAAPYLQHVSGNLYLCSRSFPAFLLTYVAIGTSTVVFHRDLLPAESTWFDETLICFEDLDYWFRLAEHTPFVFVNEMHTIVRKHLDSLTGTTPTATRIDGIAVRKAHLERLRSRMSPAEQSAAAQNISALQFHVAYAERCAGHASSARRWFAASWRTSPTVAAAMGVIKSFLPRPGGYDMHEPPRTPGDNR